MSGTLYLCATPIGNLGDISLRCIEVLKTVDLIAAEDTRRTIQLLNHLGISKPLTSYHEHNKHDKGAYIISLLKDGKNVAQVSDAGTPAISDPGEDLVKLCIENGITVTSIPGPIAGINALILSGLPAGRFSFEGFLSVNKRHRYEHLDSLRNDTHTLIFYEAPHKLRRTVDDMLSVFGEDRQIVLVRELTKLHEEIIRTTLKEASEYLESNTPRGEYVIIVEGASFTESTSSAWWEELSVTDHIDKYIREGLSSKEAIKKTSLDRNCPKRDIYNEYHKN